MTHRTYVTVDPGKGGAIAWSNRRGAFVEPMPETRRDTITLVDRALEDAVNPVAYYEKVAAYIPDGGASAMITYGRMIERVGCILELRGIKLIEITPQNWQKELSLGKSERISPPRMPNGYTKAQKTIWREQNKLAIRSAKAHNDKAKRDWKAKLRGEAQRRFPALNVTAKTCDALLLLDVAVKLEGEKLNL